MCLSAPFLWKTGTLVGGARGEGREEGADVGETRVSGDREGGGETGVDMMPGGYAKKKEEEGKMNISGEGVRLHRQDLECGQMWGSKGRWVGGVVGKGGGGPGWTAEKVRVENGVEVAARGAGEQGRGDGKDQERTGEPEMQVESEHVGQVEEEDRRGREKTSNEGDTEVNSHAEAELS